MAGEDVLERFRAARTALAQARDLLITPSPERLECCGTQLQAAVSHLAGFPQLAKQSAGDAGALAEARQLRKAVVLAGTLLRSAADYHAKWDRILGARSGGYTARGDAAPVVRPGRVWVRG